MTRITIDSRNRIIFYGSPAGYLQENKAVVDPLFQNNELENWLTVRNSFEVEWQQGVFEKLSSGSWVQGENAPPLKNIRIWQLKPESDILMKFIGYDEVVDGFGEPSPENYNMVFDGD
ncbi:MAG: YodL domain-containing protein, partial [Oscillospiraceae bacterium]